MDYEITGDFSIFQYKFLILGHLIDYFFHQNEWDFFMQFLANGKDNGWL